MHELTTFGKNCVNFIRIIKPLFKCRGLAMPGYSSQLGEPEGRVR